MIQITEYLLNKNKKLANYDVELGMPVDDFIKYLKFNGFEETKSRSWKEELSQYRLYTWIGMKECTIHLHKNDYNKYLEYLAYFDQNGKLSRIVKVDEEHIITDNKAIDVDKFMQEIA